VFTDQSLEQGLRIAEKFGKQNTSAHMTELHPSIGIEEEKLARGVTLRTSTQK